MVSLTTARRLKNAGLNWIPALHDFFAIPDRGLDDKVFVISDVMAHIEVRNNLQMVTFQGAVEWALDFLLASEVIWLPTEAQLRMAIMRLLIDTDQKPLILTSSRGGYRCEASYGGVSLAAESPEASEAYAEVLLQILAAA